MGNVNTSNSAANTINTIEGFRTALVELKMPSYLLNSLNGCESIDACVSHLRLYLATKADVVASLPKTKADVAASTPETKPEQVTTILNQQEQDLCKAGKKIAAIKSIRNRLELTLKVGMELCNDYIKHAGISF